MVGGLAIFAVGYMFSKSKETQWMKPKKALNTSLRKKSLLHVVLILNLLMRYGFKGRFSEKFSYLLIYYLF